MDKLDVHTSRGARNLAHQYRTQWYIERMGYSVSMTPTDNFPVDIVISKSEYGKLRVVGVAEIKSREDAGALPITLDYIERNGYLITHEKLLSGIEIAKQLRVPYYLVVRLIRENRMLIWKVTDEDGNEVLTYELRNTWTQKTCNGGRAIRENAYLSATDAKIINCNRYDNPPFDH